MRIAGGSQDRVKWTLRIGLLMFDNPQVVKRGTWLYDGTAKSAVRIIETDIAYGSGDHEDLPEIRDDRSGEFFYVQWAPPGDDVFKGSSGPFSTIQEAIVEVEKHTQGTVRWG